MTKQKISDGAVHKLPKYLNTIIQADTSLYEIWEDITPLARNEWICWIEDAKKQETRDRRIKIMIDKFSQGKRRPCCWAGCTHR